MLTRELVAGKLQTSFIICSFSLESSAITIGQCFTDLEASTTTPFAKPIIQLEKEPAATDGGSPLIESAIFTRCMSAYSAS